MEKKTRIKKRMTAAEFEAVKPLLTMKPARLEGARLALVEGLTLAAAAERVTKEFELSTEFHRQSVGEAVTMVWAEFQKVAEAQNALASVAGDIPEGWESVTLVAPAHLIAKFREEISMAAPKPPRAKRGKGRPGEVK